MVLDDLLIGSLRITARNLQDLIQYLESRNRLAGDDVTYSQHKMRYLIQQLKELQRLVDQETRRAPVVPVSRN